MRFLHRRQGLLDAVVFSGGEPTLQDGLAFALSEVRGLGFATGLHTGGIYPSRLEELWPLLSWVGMDIKSGFADYDRVTRTPGSGKKARVSAKLLLESGVPHEFRTTVHPLIHTQDTLLRLTEELCALGVRHYVLQEFRPQGCVDGQFLTLHSSHKLLDEMFLERISQMFDTFSVRRA